MKVLLIDNYDSFTYNLYQYVGEILHNQLSLFVLQVYRNDQITLKEIEEARFDKIIISPGPGNPKNKFYFGVCANVITKIGKKTPILGVCLGMQGIAHYFGGRVIRAKLPMHGKMSIIKHDGKSIFKALPQKLEVMRYHSLIVDQNNLPECLEISSKSLDSNEIMGLRHKKYPIEGIQFHPESFNTEGGKKILTNFLFNYEPSAG